MSPAPYYFYRFNDSRTTELFDPELEIIGELRTKYGLRSVDPAGYGYEYVRNGRVLTLVWREREISIGGRHLPPEQWAVEFLYDVLVRTETLLMCPDGPGWWCTATESQIPKAPTDNEVELIENLGHLMDWFGVHPHA